MCVRNFVSEWTFLFKGTSLLPVATAPRSPATIESSAPRPSDINPWTFRSEQSCARAHERRRVHLESVPGDPDV